MKKVLALFLTAGLIIGLTACGSSASSDNGGAAPAANSGSSSQAAPSGGSDTASGSQSITINLLGEDVPVELSLPGDGSFTAAYSFNGNDVKASGTIDDKGMMTVESYTPEDVPEMYVQGAVDVIAEVIAE